MIPKPNCETCLECHGAGFTIDTDGPVTLQLTCPHCGGQGYTRLPDRPCNDAAPPFATALLLLLFVAIAAAFASLLRGLY